jgi:hypothetical protein
VLELLGIVLAERKEERSVPVLSLATTGRRGHRCDKRSADGPCPIRPNPFENLIEILNKI